MILKTIKNDKAKDFTERFEEMLESIDPSILDNIDYESFPTDIETMKRNSVAYAKMRADWEFMSNSVVLVYTTPSGHGLRIVFKGMEGFFDFFLMLTVDIFNDTYFSVFLE